MTDRVQEDHSGGRRCSSFDGRIAGIRCGAGSGASARSAVQHRSGRMGSTSALVERDRLRCSRSSGARSAGSGEPARPFAFSSELWSSSGRGGQRGRHGGSYPLPPCGSDRQRRSRSAGAWRAGSGEPARPFAFDSDLVAELRSPTRARRGSWRCGHHVHSRGRWQRGSRRLSMARHHERGPAGHHQERHHHVPDVKSILAWRDLIVAGQPHAHAFDPDRVRAAASRTPKTRAPHTGRSCDGCMSGATRGCSLRAER